MGPRLKTNRAELTQPIHRQPITTAVRLSPHAPAKSNLNFPVRTFWRLRRGQVSSDPVKIWTVGGRSQRNGLSRNPIFCQVRLNTKLPQRYKPPLVVLVVPNYLQSAKSSSSSNLRGNAPRESAIEKSLIFFVNTNTKRLLYWNIVGDGY